MLYRDLPNTDLHVSAVGLGTTELGTEVRGGDADRLVAAFLDAGGTHIDTAHCYSFWKPGGLGASEREVGAALRRLKAWDRAVVATKGGHPDNGPDYARPDRYQSPEVIASDVRDSLERLGAERIDLYYLHRDDTRAPAGEVIEALNAEIAAGRVRYLGASNWSTERIGEANAYAAAHGLQGFVASQVQWSLAEPTWRPTADPTVRYMTADDAAWCARAGLAVAAYSSTANGFFADPGKPGSAFDTPDNHARAERARRLAAELGRTPTQVALAYILNQRPATIALVGTTNLDHLAEAVQSADITLSADQVEWLRSGRGQRAE